MGTPYTLTISRVRNALTRTFSEIYPWFEQPEDVRAYKPADGGWSINEVLEHITLTTHYLMIIVRKGWPKAIKRAETQEIKGTESDLEALIPIRARGAFRWIRPEHMEPAGKRPADVLTVMRQQETECLEILSKIGRGEGALFKVRMSVNNLGISIFISGSTSSVALLRRATCESAYRADEREPVRVSCAQFYNGSPEGLMKVLLRIVLSILVLLCLVYVADYFLLRHKISVNQGYGTVTVQRYYSIKQKNGKTEFTAAEPEDVPCINSLFPHSSYAPCWYLRRHAEKEIDI